MKRRLPPLNALRAFEAAARLGRMTAAAQELSVSPGAISRQVRQLELHLGVPLFGGTKARPTLTAAALTLQPAVSSAFQRIEDAVREIGNDAPGPLDVGCYSTFAVKWLIPRLFDFHARHPGVEVRLRTTDAGADAQRCDLWIAAEPAASGLEDGKGREDAAFLLFAERLGPVLTPALIQHRPLRQPADLPGHTLLSTRTRGNAWDMWAAAVGAAPPAGTGTAEFEHYYFTLEAAARGLGVAVAPWHLVVDDVQAGRLVAPLGFTVSGYQYVARCRAVRDARLKQFCAWLQAQAQDAPLPSDIS